MDTFDPNSVMDLDPNPYVEPMQEERNFFFDTPVDFGDGYRFDPNNELPLDNYIFPMHLEYIEAGSNESGGYGSMEYNQAWGNTYSVEITFGESNSESSGSESENEHDFDTSGGEHDEEARRGLEVELVWGRAPFELDDDPRI